MSKTIKTKLEYKKAVKELEKISDNPDFGDNPKDIIEYEALSNSIVEYQNLNFNILKMSDKYDILSGCTECINFNNH